MIDRSHLVTVQGCGLALALIVAAALSPTHALAASSECAASTSSITEDSTRTIRLANVHPSPVVNDDDGDSLAPEVRHHWPSLDGDGPLGPLVRHHWP